MGNPLTIHACAPHPTPPLEILFQSILFQFMIGRELNPRIRDFDIKFFVELRPNLIGWLLMDVCMAAKQYTNIGRLTNSMVLVLIAQVLYIVDALYNEVSAKKAWKKKAVLLFF
jgi:hypothetical protein